MHEIHTIISTKLIEENQIITMCRTDGIKQVLALFAASTKPRSRLVCTLANGSAFELYMSEGEVKFLV